MVRLIALVLCSLFVAVAGAQDAYPCGRCASSCPSRRAAAPTSSGASLPSGFRQPRPAGGDREPRRRGRQRRRRGGGALGARWLHHRAGRASLAISPTLYSKLNYDPVKDFAPMSLVATVPNVIITQPSLPATLQEFIALARAQPGAHELRLGRSGTSNHLAGELFNIVTGVKLVHVPYKGVNLAMQDVLARDIHFVVHRHSRRPPHIKAGRCAHCAARAATLACAARGSDRRGSGPQGVRSHHLVRGDDARRHAEPDRHAAQPELVKTMHAPE